eukprot:gnl/Spiro4/94_TR51_c0_g1_i1.p1 gnl/Spiro4/94_TR51_c0_g1~~gnl/Spiro4/94_TR51_c0_g1_i1.p1  ORF type:complete len:274 (-),score=66.93 gnl/Spiro4/94_TR51_c0_g1_i1:151-882(-)
MPVGKDFTTELTKPKGILAAVVLVCSVIVIACYASAYCDWGWYYGVPREGGCHATWHGATVSSRYSTYGVGIAAGCFGIVTAACWVVFNLAAELDWTPWVELGCASVTAILALVAWALMADDVQAYHDGKVDLGSDGKAGQFAAGITFAILLMLAAGVYGFFAFKDTPQGRGNGGGGGGSGTTTGGGGGGADGEAHPQPANNDDHTDTTADHTATTTTETETAAAEAATSETPPPDEQADNQA